MGDQIYSIEFLISFLTIYNNIVCTDGKVPAKIILLYGGISSYSARSLEHAFQCHDQKIVNCFLITFLISSHSEYQAHRTWIQRNQLNPMIIATFHHSNSLIW